MIPKSLQEKLLQELHNEHTGISKMKALARSHMWWAGLDNDGEVMPRMPIGKASSSSSPNASVDLAIKAVATSPYQLRMTISWEDVLYSCGNQSGRK